MKEIMTAEEVAELLSVHPQTIRKWVRAGELTAADTPAGWRITADDIEKWLEKHRRTEQQRQPPHEGEQS